MRSVACSLASCHPDRGLAASERAGNAGHQADRAEVDVLIELAAEQDQRAPKGDVIGDLIRPADGAEEDRVMVADLVLPVVGEHGAVLQVVVAGGEVELVELELEAELAGGGLERADAFGDDFTADAVAGDHGYFVGAAFLAGSGHGQSAFRVGRSGTGSRWRTRRMSRMVTADTISVPPTK